jgi:hypothetical protein
MNQKEDNERELELGHPPAAERGTEELEGSEKAFRRKDAFPLLKPVPDDEKEPQEALMGPGGDSRPDPTEDAGFVTVEESGERDFPPDPQKPDMDELDEMRVGQDDEIVAGNDPVLERPINLLRPRISKKGAESEGL